MKYSANNAWLTKSFNGYELIKFIPEGNPLEDILKTAENWKDDLLVLGRHGRTGLKHLFTGSVAERVLHHTNIPIMVVP
ncbi:MAG: universal stress protein [Aequorivita sp.]